MARAGAIYHRLLLFCVFTQPRPKAAVNNIGFIAGGIKVLQIFRSGLVVLVVVILHGCASAPMISPPTAPSVNGSIKAFSLKAFTDPFVDQVEREWINNASCGGVCNGSAASILNTSNGTRTLGDGGVITLNFVDNLCRIDNTSAPDIIVYEFAGSHPESYSVAVALRGDSLVGEISGPGSGANFLDLTPLGISEFNQIRITDTSGLFPGRRVNGADIMGVECIFTFGAPVLIEELVAAVILLNLNEGIQNSLDAKLDTALQALDDMNQNNDVAAFNALQAFINAVNAQRGNSISVEDADVLVAGAQAIIDQLGT